jgi:biotin transport system ATP-binding protein
MPIDTSDAAADGLLVRVEGLSHRFADGRLGLDRVDLSVRRGELLALAGRNGSGKTTLLRHLNGLLMPSAGLVWVDGRTVAADPAQARRRVGIVFQDADSQIVGETVYDDVAFGPENQGLEPEAVRGRVADALAAVDLTALAARRPHELSGGEKRRLAIAGVLAMGPPVIALDEPFANLDYPGVCQVLGHLLALRAAGRTLVVASHDLDKIAAHADRLVVLAAGRVVLEGPPAVLAGQVEAFGVRSPEVLPQGGTLRSWLT